MTIVSTGNTTFNIRVVLKLDLPTKKKKKFKFYLPSINRTPTAIYPLKSMSLS